MDNYKKQIRELRSELHNNKKEIRELENKNNKYDKIYNGIIKYILAFSTISSVIAAGILTNFALMIIAILIFIADSIIPSVVYSIRSKNKIKIENLNKIQKQIKDEIKNTHYFKLEKQRNKVIEENGVNTLEATQRLINILNEYKIRINGICDNQIPKEVDKEIEYLENQDKIFKLSK